MTDFFNFSIKYSEKLENEGCVREQFEKCTSEKKERTGEKQRSRNKDAEGWVNESHSADWLRVRETHKSCQEI